ncbi:TetR/AcrR family transcriptional regulator [Shimia sagamensis]|uniref:Transcriptional regulator, TetR family n=1 Tax=Shimia sagamensis TaxID=1566352 RepID=A0ABY1NFU6_9RHOB|nr:TetR/AcrR family transcriptional regulator [Shimia sagamensis]SMP08427.1 transcriptional regulator, TetR family [Shimia sagamensis]
MPKIVDHDAHRADLALRAASYFSEHGYGGVSMRKVAAHLGVSKSALYHYFPTKEALFLATTKEVMKSVAVPQVGGTTQAAQIQALTEAMAPTFGSEMALLFDYLRGKSADEIAQDEAMQVSVAAHRAAVAEIVGEEATQETLERMMGRLLIGYFRGENRET